MAAHLHDSVLQTLALIQKHASDGRTVATLARAQERDLRSWLYGEEAPPDTSVASALKAAAAEVEDGHGVPVEVVTVGDTAVSERRPAAGPRRTRGDGQRCEALRRRPGRRVRRVHPPARRGLRPRPGPGFDESTVPEDRLGVRNSIVDRMRRHGGSAAIRTAPGDGTEVRLTMTTSSTDQEEPA